MQQDIIIICKKIKFIYIFIIFKIDYKEVKEMFITIFMVAYFSKILVAKSKTFWQDNSARS